MDQEEIDIYIETAEEGMQSAVERLQKELLKVRTGKASPAMFNGILAEYYGTQTPIGQMANISISDARTILIQPWEKTVIPNIEKAIFEANLGVTPQNDGELIRISIPPLTEERRKDLVKKVKQIGEEAKISIRNSRREAMDGIKQGVKDGYPEDMGKDMEARIQNKTNDYSEKVNHLVQGKEKEIMTI